MHDWTLKDISYSWGKKVCLITLKRHELDDAQIICYDPLKVCIPQLNEWGESESVNLVKGPYEIEGAKELVIEMQSGDEITIKAKRFELP